MLATIADVYFNASLQQTIFGNICSRGDSNSILKRFRELANIADVYFHRIFAANIADVNICQLI